MLEVPLAPFIPSSCRAPPPLAAVGFGESLTKRRSGGGDFVVEEPGGGAVAQLNHHTDAFAIGDLEVLNGAGGVALQGGDQVGGIRSRTRVTRTFEPMVMAAWDMSGATKSGVRLTRCKTANPWLPNGSFPAWTWPMVGW